MSISHWEEAAQKKYELFLFYRESGKKRRIMTDNITDVKPERFLRKIKDSTESISFPVVCLHVKELLDVE